MGARRSMPKQAGTSARPAAAMARAPGARLDVCGQRSRAARKHERRAAVLRSPGPCGRAAAAGGLARARSGGAARRAAGARVAHPPQLLPGRQARPQARRAVAALLRAAGRPHRRAQRLRMCPLMPALSQSAQLGALLTARQRRPAPGCSVGAAGHSCCTASRSSQHVAGAVSQPALLRRGYTRGRRMQSNAIGNACGLVRGCLAPAGNTPARLQALRRDGGPAGWLRPLLPRCLRRRQRPSSLASCQHSKDTPARRVCLQSLEARQAQGPVLA